MSDKMKLLSKYIYAKTFKRVRPNFAAKTKISSKRVL